MPAEWYLMNRPLFNSGLEDEEFWAFGIDGFNELLDSAIASDVFLYDRSIAARRVSIRAIVQNVTSDTVNNTTVRQILCNIGNLKCGQYVRIEDSWWLVVTLPDNNRIYEKAILWKCKCILRFLSPVDGETILEYPIYDTNSTQYGTGEENKTAMSIGSGEHLIYLPHNDETVLIDRGFRFIMDRNMVNPTVYRITQVDSTSYAVGGESDGGLLQWSVIETPFNEETDSREEMIADYFKSEIGGDDPVIETSIVLTDEDGDQRIALGEEKRVRVAVDTGDGTQPLEMYEASVEPDDGACVIAQRSGDTVTLRCGTDRADVGKLIHLHVYSESLGQEARLAIQIVNW